MRACALVILLSAGPAFAQPAGVVLSAGGGRLQRAGTELPIGLKSGDILFAGDALAALNEPATVLFCAQKAMVTLAPRTEVVVEARQLKVRAGSLAGSKPVGSCFLPAVDRTAVASQQHYGASLVRAMKPDRPGPRLPTLPEAERAAILAELPPESDDASTILARAAVLERHNLKPDAAAEYRKLAARWPDAAWLHSRLFELENERVEPQAPDGKTYALLVGISKYRSEQVPALRFADQDALVFEKYLKSPRGGALPDSDVILLSNESATTAAIRNAFETFLKVRAGPKDTVVVFLAAHGVAEPERGAFLVTFDSDPQDLAATALPMQDIQKLVRDDLKKVGRVMAYVDACRSATVGTIDNRTQSLNSSVERLQEAEGELFLFTASRAKELSYEGPQFGGGHGAFSYFLLSAFNGEADRNGDKSVDLNEVIEYVRAKVAEGTFDRQHPRDFGSLETTVKVADTVREGIPIAKWSGPTSQEPQLLTQTTNPQSDTIARSLKLPDEAPNLDAAISAGRLLPGKPGSAFEVLGKMRGQLPPETYLGAENRLRVALEDRGQEVLLHYLKGDQEPQTRADFAAGAEWFDAALRLTPESLLLQSRTLFCTGRAKLFDKQYREAADMLERALRFDPTGAYSYNALGIAYLEQAQYDRAIAAFHDAIRLAPFWAYPLHNLALTHTERGDYDAAIRAYRRAMQLAPRYSYLPYNLGLLYQRMNRRKEAEAAYRAAIALTPDRGEPYNALGYLRAAAGRREEAERAYRQALQKDPALVSARHNLAVLLAEQPARMGEALSLWRENLANDPEYLPTLLSLARALARSGDAAEARRHFETVLRLKPDYAAARVALADLYLKTGQPQAAVDQLNAALKLQPRGWEIHEAIGDAETARGRPQEAAAAYEAALANAPDGAARKKIQRKLRR